MIDIINLAVLLNPNHLEALKVPLWYLVFPFFGDFWKILKTMQRTFLILVSLLMLILHLVRIPKMMSNLKKSNSFCNFYWKMLYSKNMKFYCKFPNSPILFMV